MTLDDLWHNRGKMLIPRIGAAAVTPVNVAPATPLVYFTGGYDKNIVIPKKTCDHFDVAGTRTVTDWVLRNGATWKILPTAGASGPSGWQNTGFDDSSWASQISGFSLAASPGSGYYPQNRNEHGAGAGAGDTVYPGSTYSAGFPPHLYARITITVPATASYTIGGFADDTLDIWVDGTNVANFSGSPSYELFGTLSLTAGSHLLAVHLRGDNVYDAFALAIYGTHTVPSLSSDWTIDSGTWDNNGGSGQKAEITGTSNVVQIADSGVQTSGTATATFSAPTTAGNLLVAVLGGSFISSAMPAGWSKLNGVSASSTDGGVELWYYINAPSVTTVTATASSFGNLFSSEIVEFALSGSATATSAGTFNHPATGSTLTATSTPTGAGIAVLAWGSRYSSVSVTNFTEAVPGHNDRYTIASVGTNTGITPTSVVTEGDSTTTNFVMGYFQPTVPTSSMWPRQARRDLGMSYVNLSVDVARVGNDPVVFADDFTRADNVSLGNGWVGIIQTNGYEGTDTYINYGDQTNVVSIVSNQAKATGGRGDSTRGQSMYAGAYREYDTADFDISVTITQNATGGILARVNAAGNQGIYQNGGGQLVGWNGVTYGGVGHQFVAGDVMRMTGVGSAIKVYQNGTLVLSVTTTDGITNTKHGIGFGGLTEILDNFSITTIPIAGILFAYDPTADTGYLLTYNGGTTMTLKQKTSGVYTTLATGTCPAFTAANINIIYGLNATSQPIIQAYLNDGSGTVLVISYSFNLLTLNQWGLESGTATGWQSLISPTGNYVYPSIPASSTAYAYEGTRSLTMSNSPAGGAIPLMTPPGLNGFPVLPSAQYNFSFRYWRVGSSSVTAGFEWFDASGNWISSDYYTVYGTSGGQVDSGWQDGTANRFAPHVSPSNAVYGAAVLSVGNWDVGGQPAFFDTLGVYQTTTQTPIFHAPGAASVFTGHWGGLYGTAALADTWDNFCWGTGGGTPVFNFDTRNNESWKGVSGFRTIITGGEREITDAPLLQRLTQTEMYNAPGASTRNAVTKDSGNNIYFQELPTELL